ncbi:MAG: C1 family peptidase [Chlorobi bacterium]|nr:C1 family peptidase [Chlorobiota bacterium]
MKKLIKSLFIASFIIGIFTAFPSCDEETTAAILEGLGWYGLGGELGDDTTQIENDIYLGDPDDLPSSVDLSPYFPPIGDQGAYGTCVAWATGYNHKSFLEAWDDNHRTSFSESQKFSPKYLFWTIPSSDKGDDCNGTGFEPAYDVMIANGIADLATTPYTDLGDCSSYPASYEHDVAANHKIESYRQVNVDVETLKQYLAQGRALSFGAKLGENFMAWNSGDVIDWDTDTYQGQHAYHAMTLCGYDDSKGNNGAFRVVNTWGTSWGDGGYIWVDYNFFVNDFAFCAFAATNKFSNPDSDGDNEVDEGEQNQGIDLMAWELYDLQDDNYPDDSRARVAKYNAFNSGTENIDASNDWNIIYIYYNANNANDYGILLYDYYTDDYGSYGEDGDLNDYNAGDSEIGNNWWNYINIPAGQSVAQALYGGEDARFSWAYEMPEISGEYYLVIIVDGYDVIQEFDESNNYFYLTDANGGPITFYNGVMQESPAKSFEKNLNPQIGDDSPKQSVITEENLNAYSTKEIRKLIDYRLKSGDIQRKASMLKSAKVGKKTNG